jgi:hypothetical protein
MSADPAAYTWEDILRAVTIPGRPDRLYHLQHQWYKALQVLDVISKALREIRSQVDDHKWTGPGADAYRKHFDQMIKSIDKVYADASTMMDIAETLAVNLASAISSIPCPNWSTAHGGHWDNNWQYYINLSTANNHGGETHYQYFTDHPDRYNTHGIKSYFEYWMKQRTSYGGPYYYNGGKHALDTWYARNTQQARNAFGSLIATYQDCSYSMPDLSGDTIELQSDYTPKGSSHSASASEWSTGSMANSYSTNCCAPADYTPDESTTSRSNSATSSQSLGGTAPYNTNPYGDGGKDSGTSLAGSSPDSVPDAPGTYGASGLGGYGGSSTVTGYGSTSGYGSSSGTAPVDRANAGQPGLPANVASTAPAQNSNAYGAIPSFGAGRGPKDGGTRQTWLTADEDFFAVENPGPPPIIDQNYMDELDEREKRRRDWW